MLASAGGILVAPVVHEVGLSLAILLGVIALGRGIAEHGFMMPSAVGGLGLGVMAGSLGLPEDGAGTLYTIIGALRDPDGEGGRRLVAALTGVAALLDPQVVEGRGLSATVVVAQLRSAAVDLFAIVGVDSTDAQALLP